MNNKDNSSWLSLIENGESVRHIYSDGRMERNDKRQHKCIKLNDKRFWIFEASTIVYSILVNSFVELCASPSVIEFKLIFAGLCCICGVITWLLANGKHWLLFGLIYEIVLLTTFWIIWGILSIGEMSNNSSNIAMTMEDWHIIIALNVGVIFFTLIPTLLLAFIGYQIFRNKVNGTSTRNSKIQSGFL